MEVETMKSDVGMSWKKMRLVDVCDFQGGTQPPKSEWITTPRVGYVRMIQIRDFTQGKESFIEYVKDSKTLKKCQEDDIMIGRYGASIGKILTGISGAYNVALVKTIPSDELDKRYFFHYLNTTYFQNFIQNAGSRAAQAGFNKEELKDLEIPLPPLSTQKRIAEILDAADALRRKDQELLKKYDELAQAIFIDMFGDPVKNEKGWEVRKLGTVSNMKAGNFISASEIYTDIDDGLYPCYGGNGLRGFVKSHTHNGDYILIGRQGALCGNVKIATGKFHATEHAVVCSPKIEYNVLWLYFLLGNLNLNKYSSGAAQPGLNVSTLVNIDLIFAPIKFQNQFAEKLKSIEIQFEKIKGNLLNSNKLFNSLIQKAFKGELVS